MLRRNFPLNKQLANSEPPVFYNTSEIWLWWCVFLYRHLCFFTGGYLCIWCHPTWWSEAPPCAVPSTSTPAGGVGDSCGVWSGIPPKKVLVVKYSMYHLEYWVVGRAWSTNSALSVWEFQVIPPNITSMTSQCMLISQRACEKFLLVVNFGCPKPFP